MPRRRAFKLSLAALVVITVVWIASGWVGVWYSRGTTLVGIGRGAVVGFDATYRSEPPGFGYKVFFGYNVFFPRDMTLLPELAWAPGLQLTIPLWIPLLLVATPTVIAWRRDRKLPPGHCRCGYNLTGNVSGRCPECGTEVETGL